MVEIKGVNERLAVLKLKLEKTVVLTLIQVYAPTNQDEFIAKEKFYCTLNKTFESEKEYYTVALGDFNAKIGNENINDRNIGRFRSGETNENGAMLTQWIFNTNMKLISSYYKMKESRRWTWIPPPPRWSHKK